MLYVGVPVLGLVVLALLFSWSWFIPLAEARASAALGRKVTIGGLHVALGRTTEVLLTGVRIDNPEGFAPDPPFAQIERLAVQLDVAAYWHRREIVIPAITVTAPQLEVLAPDRERNNYTLALGGPTGENAPDAEAAQPKIGTVTIQGGRVHVLHAPLRADFQVQVETKQDAGAEPQLVARANGTYAAQRLTAQLTGGALLSLRDTEQPWPMDLRVENGPTRAALHGTLRNPLAFAGANLRLEFSGPDMALLTPLTGVPIPQTPRYRVAGQLDYGEGRVRFTGIQGQLGNSDLEGSITVDPRGAKPDVVAELRSRRVDLADLAGFIGGTPGRNAPTRPDGPASGKVLPDTPINFPKLDAANVHLRYEAGQIAGRSTPLDNLRVTLELVDGNLSLRPLQFGIGRGDISATVALTPQAGGNIHAVADANFRRLDIRRLMEAAGSQGGGELNGRARLDATGRSTAQLLAHGNGSVTLSTAGGNLSALLIDLSGLRIGSAVLSLLGVPARTELQCFVADFGLERGVLNTRALLLETADALLTGGGTIRLDEERLDYRVRSESKHLTVAALPTSLAITGTFGNPSVLPDLTELGVRGGLAAALGIVAGPAALLPTIEFGIGEDPRCRSTLERLRRVPATSGAVPARRSQR